MKRNKSDVLFEDDHQPTMKKTKLDKEKALVPDEDETAFLKAFANSRSKTFFQSELHELTGLSMTKIIDLTSKLCEKVNPSSLRSKLRLKPAAAVTDVPVMKSVMMTLENQLLFPGDSDQHPTVKKAKSDKGKALVQDATVKPSSVMTPRQKRLFESLFGDSEPTPSMVMDHQMAESGKRVESQQKMKRLESSSSRQLVVINAKKSSAATDGKKKDAILKPVTSRLKRKSDVLFDVDDSDKQSRMKKKAKLDKSKAKAQAIIAAEETTFLRAFESGQWHDKTQLAKLTNLPMTSIDRLAKKHCRRVVPFSRKSKAVKPDLRLQLVEREEKAAAASLRKSSSQEAVVMRQRHQKRLKSLKLEDGGDIIRDAKKVKDQATKSKPILYSVLVKQPSHQLESAVASSNRLVEWKIPRNPDGADSTTLLRINETTSPLGQIYRQPLKKLLGWKIPRKPIRITSDDACDDWSKYG